MPSTKEFQPALKCTFLFGTELSIKSCPLCSSTAPTLHISTHFLLSELDLVPFSAIKQSFWLHVLRDLKFLIIFTVCSLASSLSVLLLSSKLQVESTHLLKLGSCCAVSRALWGHLGTSRNGFDGVMVSKVRCILTFVKLRCYFFNLLSIKTPRRLYASFCCSLKLIWRVFFVLCSLLIYMTFWDPLGHPWVSSSHCKATQTFCQGGFDNVRRGWQVVMGQIVWELEGEKENITWRTCLPEEFCWGQALRHHKGLCVACGRFYPCRNVSLVQVLLTRVWFYYLITKLNNHSLLLLLADQYVVTVDSCSVPGPNISPQSAEDRNTSLFSHPAPGKSCGWALSVPQSPFIQDTCCSF